MILTITLMTIIGHDRVADADRPAAGTALAGLVRRGRAGPHHLSIMGPLQEITPPARPGGRGRTVPRS